MWGPAQQQLLYKRPQVARPSLRTRTSDYSEELLDSSVVTRETTREWHGGNEAEGPVERGATTACGGWITAFEKGNSAEQCGWTRGYGRTPTGGGGGGQSGSPCLGNRGGGLWRPRSSCLGRSRISYLGRSQSNDLGEYCSWTVMSDQLYVLRTEKGKRPCSETRGQASEGIKDNPLLRQISTLVDVFLASCTGHLNCAPWVYGR